jgi:hypothetical protein
LRAAAFSFFSDMRFAIRALDETCIVRYRKKREMRCSVLELGLLFLLVFEPANLKSAKVTTALETQGSD